MTHAPIFENKIISNDLLYRQCLNNNKKLLRRLFFDRKNLSYIIFHLHITELEISCTLSQCFRVT
jgi:hypothetical protein